MRYLDTSLTKYVQNIYTKNCKTQMKQRSNKALFHNLSVKRNICNPLLLTFCCIIFPVSLCIYNGLSEMIVSFAATST